MRKIFTSLTRWSSAALLAAAAAFAPWQSADAQTRLLDENFDYPAGNLYQQGGWLRVGTNNAAPIQVVDNTLTYPGYQDEATGKAVAMTDTKSGEDLFTFFKDNATVNSGEIYASFLMNVSGANTTSPGYFFCWVIQTSKGMADGKSATETGKVFMTPGSDDNHYKLGLTISKGTGYVETPAEYEVGQTYLVVLRFTVVEGSGNDKYELWVNPATNTGIAPEADVVFNDQQTDPSMTSGGFCGVELRQATTASNHSPDCTIDALRVATAWADLFPEQTVQTPTIVASPSQGRIGTIYSGMQVKSQTTLSAQNLTGDVTVTCPAGVTCDKTTIPAADAMAADGVTLTFTMTAPNEEGEFEKTVTFSSEGAQDATFTLSGEIYVVTDVPSAGAARTNFVSGDKDATYHFTGKAVVTAIEKYEYGYGNEYNIYATDLLGGICVNSAFYAFEEAPVAVGDEIGDFYYVYNTDATVPILTVIPVDAEGTFVKVTQTGQTINPLELNLSNLNESSLPAYLFRLFKVQGLKFEGISENAVFEKGKKYTVTNGEHSFKVRAMNGSDLIGQPIPSGNVILSGISESMSAFELILRSRADVEEVGDPAVNIMREQMFDFTSNAAAINAETQVMKYTVVAENLPAAVPVLITGKNADMFAAEPASLPAGSGTTEVIINYRPTEIGMHNAGVFFDFDAINPELNYTNQFPVSKAYDPANMPAITISPVILELETTPGVPVTGTATLTSVGTFDYITGSRAGTGDNGGITINNVYMPAGSTDIQLTVTFSPKEEGDYTETWTYTSTLCETPATLVVKARCTGEAPIEDPQGDPELKVDWSNPYPYYTQDFAGVQQNEPLKLDGWCNYAVDGTRAWWGYTGANGDDFTAAKVTAYDSNMKPGEGTEGTTILLSPALDFKNAANKHIKFRLMGMYLNENSGDELVIGMGEPNPEAGEGEPDLLLYELDGFAVPATADEAGKWVEYDVDMSVIEDMPDTFCIAFTFYYTRGADNSTTYYITDFQWGGKTQSIDAVNSDACGFTPDTDGWYNIYNAQGILVLRTKDAAYLKTLPAGLYLSRGAKHIIK